MTSSSAAESKRYLSCRPFLKWAGGKTQLLPDLLERVPLSFQSYHEPFVGGGALFFSLQPTQAILSDMNSELINAYLSVRDEVDALIEDLGKHVYESDYFYKVRDVDRSVEFKQWKRVNRSARLIYLNKTCFNGLYRVNSKGYFNVPFGRYVNPKIVDRKNLLACSEMLQRTELLTCNFEEVLSRVKTGDFVYFDPPYAPLNKTSNFTSYTNCGFGTDEQCALAEVCRELDRRGVMFMVSNSATDGITSLYQKYLIEAVPAVRAINSKADRRGFVDELIIRNYGSPL